MTWQFRHATDITPELVTDDESTVEESSDEIVETPYTGCAWCGDGDGNGLCSDCEAKYFPPKSGGGRS